MKLSQIVEEVRRLSDEAGEPMASIAGYVNDAIAKINIRLKSEFPYMNPNNGEQEPAFPEKWQRALLIPFAVGRIKQVDSSQFEYTDAYNEFMMGLDDMASGYLVPEIYKEALNYSTTSDVFVNPPLPWRW